MPFVGQFAKIIEVHFALEKSPGSIRALANTAHVPVLEHDVNVIVFKTHPLPLSDKVKEGGGSRFNNAIFHFISHCVSF